MHLQYRIKAVKLIMSSHGAKHDLGHMINRESAVKVAP